MADLTQMLADFVKRVMARVDFYGHYPARVVAQNADGTLELIPDDTRFPGLSGVPIRYGVPGVKATVAPGARIMLGFAGGDPSKPQAELWEMASVLKLVVDSTLIEVAQPAVDAALKGTAYQTAQATFLAALSAYATAIKGVADPSNAATPPLLTAITAFGTATTAALSTKVKVG